MNDINHTHPSRPKHRHRHRHRVENARSHLLMSFLLVISLLLLPPRASYGVGAVAAFVARRMRTPSRRAISNFDECLPFVSSSSSSSSSFSTALLYKFDDGATKDDGDDGARTKQPVNESAKIKKKKSKKKLTMAKRRSHQLYKRGMQATSEEELAQHVQSIFSSEFGLGGEYNVKDDDDDDEEEEEDDEGLEPFILSDPLEEVEGSKTSSSSATTAATSLSSSSSRRRVVNNIAILDRHPSLVLNADYQPLRMLPLSIWSWQDTVKAVLSGKAVVVDIYPDVYVRAVSLDMPVPSVIALREYAPAGKARPAFTRRNVFLRDGYRCQYCSGLFRTSDLSLDHVEPRCLGGRLTWENTATCCKRCNGRKGSLRPSEIHRVGMELRSRPRCPTLFELAAEAAKFVPRRVHPTWAPFLGISPKSAVVVESSPSGVYNGGREAEDGANGVGGDRRKKMMQFRPYQ